MSAATPTLLPRVPVFPHLLPRPPQPYPTPLPKAGQPPARFNARRDLHREMEELSEEENELEEINIVIRNRGYNFLIPIGRYLTQQEEKNDESQADDDSDESQSANSGAPASIIDDGENESMADLDASMEDMDDEAGDITAETDDVEEMIEGDTEDYEDEPSDI